MVAASPLSYTAYMSEAAHTFHPTNDSFEERIRSYKAVLASYRNLEASLVHMDNKDWANRLGTPEELAEAQIILSNSMDMATKSVSASEIRKAEALGWLDVEDMKLITRLERQQEMQAQRKDKKAQQQHSDNNQFRR